MCHVFSYSRRGLTCVTSMSPALVQPGANLGLGYPVRILSDSWQYFATTEGYENLIEPKSSCVQVRPASLHRANKCFPVNTPTHFVGNARPWINRGKVVRQTSKQCVLTVHTPHCSFYNSQFNHRYRKIRSGLGSERSAVNNRVSISERVGRRPLQMPNATLSTPTSFDIYFYIL